MSDDRLGTGVFFIAHVPARVAYLVPTSDRVAFRRAIQEATTRWGGATEPIIPVRRDGRVDVQWREMAAVSRVQCAVAIDLESDVAAEAGKRLGLRVVPLRLIDRTGPSRWTCHPSAFIERGYASLIPTGFEHTPPQFTYAAPGAPLWTAVAAGELGEGHQGDYAHNRILTLPSLFPDMIANAQIWRSTVLDLTHNSHVEHWTRDQLGRNPAVIWVTARDDIRDATWFWNIRALRSLNFEPSPFLLLPDDVTPWLQFEQRIASVLQRPDEFAPDIVLQSISVNEEGLHRFARSLGWVEAEEQPRFSVKSPPPPNREPPFTYRTRIDPRHWVMHERLYGTKARTTAQLDRTRTVVEWSNPLQFTGGGSCLIRFSGDQLDQYPHRPSVARLIHRDAEWTPEELEFAVHMQAQYSFELAMPALPEVVEALLAETVGGVYLSDKGRLGLALSDLASMDALLEPGLFAAIQALTTPRSAEVHRMLKRRRSSASDRELADMAAEFGGRRDRRFRFAQQLTGLGKGQAVRVLEQLVHLSLVERGLHLACEACGLPSFVPLADATDDAACPGCRTSGAYSSTNQGLLTHYRLNTIVDRASDQGVVPHLLACAALARRAPTFILPGVHIAPGKESPEVDLFGVHGGRVVCGELKTSPQEFTPRQLKRDVELSKRLGADTHVLGSPFPIAPDAIEAAERLATRASLELLVLGPEDLQSTPWSKPPPALRAAIAAKLSSGDPDLPQAPQE